MMEQNARVQPADEAAAKAIRDAHANLVKLMDSGKPNAKDGFTSLDLRRSRFQRASTPNANEKAPCAPLGRRQQGPGPGIPNTAELLIEVGLSRDKRE